MNTTLLRFRRSLRIFVTIVCCSITVWSQAQSFLHAGGSRILDASNNEVVLRGMGLGGWLLMEGYMMQVNGGYGQWQIKRDMYLNGATPAEIETFFSSWRSAHTTAADIAYLRSLGFNCVRLPMHYDLFLTSSQRAVRDNVAYGTQTVVQYVEALSAWYDQNLLFNDLTVPGFTTINNTLQWAASNNMWVVLDMHAAPGGQGTDANISDALVGLDLYNRVDSKGRKIYQLVLERLWKSISNQYKNDSRVAMYDLINEPHGNVASTTLKAIYDQLIAAIRSNGDNHLIVLEGRGYGNDHTGMTPDLFPGQGNLVWSGHRYWLTNDPAVKDRNANQLNHIANLVNFRTKWNVPVWVGETGENSNHWIATACKNLDDRKIGWALWTHKRLMGTFNGPYEITASPMKALYSDVYTPSGRAAALTNIQFSNCLRQDDVVDAMTRMINDAAAVPFGGARTPIPGTIFASKFDQGRNGVAYNDSYFEKIPYNGDGWNSGYGYRNDGVDLQPSTDATGNGVNVGWIVDKEWLNYSVNAPESGTYTVRLRVANGDVRKVGALTVKIDGATVGTVSVPLTGDWQNWTTVTMTGTVSLSAGNHVVQVACNSRNGGGNFSWISFTNNSGARSASDAINEVASEETTIHVAPNPFTNKFRVSGLTGRASAIVIDMRGRLVHRLENVSSEGEVDLTGAMAGAYILRICDDRGPKFIKVMKE